MDIALLIMQIVTIITTSLIAILGYSLTRSKTVYDAANKLTQIRLQKVQDLRQAASAIGAAVLSLEDKNSKSLTDLREAVAKLSFLLNCDDKWDKNIVSLATEMLSLAKGYMQSDCDMNPVLNVYAEFYKATCKYLQAEWLRTKDTADIKYRTKGEKNDFKSWETYYNYDRSELENEECSKKLDN